MAAIDGEDIENSSSEDEENDLNNNGQRNFELYRAGEDAELDYVLQILNEEENDEEFMGFLPEYRRDYEFQFCDTVPEGDISLEFSERPGPWRVLDGGASAVEFFQLFFTDDLFLKLCEWTDKNAQEKINHDPQHHKGEWNRPTLEEMKAFFGIKLAMLTCVFLPRVERYFSEKPSHWIFTTPGFQNVFTYRRFVQINRYLHFCDEEMSDKSQKLYKIKPFLDIVQQNFENEYYPGQKICIDECMIPFKGRLGIKQYIKEKPTKWGIKVYMLCDSCTSYCYRFEIYYGRNSEFEGENVGLCSAVVLNLTTNMDFKGHIVYTDNYYTSPILAYNLRQRGIGMVGTVRCNRKGFPQELAKLKDRDLQRGESRWKMCGNMLACTWKDKRVIHFVSTVHKPDEVQVDRRNKNGDVEEVGSLKIIQDYNQHMGGVDLSDQMAALPKNARQYRWYLRVALKAFMWCVYNAYILEGYVVDHNRPSGRKRDFQSFIDELVHELVGTHRAERKKRGRPSNDIPDRLLNVGSHFPTSDDSDGTDHVCVVCAKKHHVYSNANGGVAKKDNPYKLTKTVFKCSECKVFLCVKKNYTCFKDYHCKKEFWK